MPRPTPAHVFFCTDCKLSPFFGGRGRAPRRQIARAPPARAMERCGRHNGAPAHKQGPPGGGARAGRAASWRRRAHDTTLCTPPQHDQNNAQLTVTGTPHPWEKRGRTRAARWNSKKRTRGPEAGSAVTPGGGSYSAVT
eukprot:gene20201-biopygen5559